ncbi:hypothetical protein [Ralstonia solanacearum]|uniref:hypothetical protein n=1 Tax=Ralstonia solanacearum TaxID=305 RepID=UPI000B0CB1D7|nr:hypothetical protein [Ralstonia solanacearum]
MAVNVKMEVSVKDVVINADGTVTISSPELAAALKEAKGVKDPNVNDGPPLGPGTPGNPIPAPQPIKPIVVITF